MELVQIFQIVFIFAFFIFALIFVLLPIRFFPPDVAAVASSATKPSSRRTQRLIDLANCFAGGVFLATCFVQLVPHVEAMFVEAFIMGGLPTEHCATLTQFVAMLGFFLILLLEQSLKVCQRGDRVSGGEGGLPPPAPESQEMVRVRSYIVTVSSSSSSDTDNDSDAELVVQERRKMIARHANRVNRGKPQNQAGAPDGEQTPGNGNAAAAGESAPINHDAGKKEAAAKATSTNRGSSRSKSASSVVRHTAAGDRRHCAVAAAASRAGEDTGPLRCVVLLLAIAVHSVFEGVAIGLQDDLWALANLATGVAVHGCLMAFSLGVSLSRQGVARGTAYRAAVAFSLAIPAGIAVGMGVGAARHGHGFAGELMSAVLQGLTAGTFVYVIFFDVLQGQADKTRDRLLKVLVTFVGFMLICALRFLVTEHH